MRDCINITTPTDQFYTKPAKVAPKFWIGGVDLDQAASSIGLKLERTKKTLVALVSDLYSNATKYGRRLHKPSGFIGVSSVEGRKLYGKQYYDRCKKFLVEHGYVIENGRYSSGRFTKSFKLSPIVEVFVINSPPENIYTKHIKNLEILPAALALDLPQGQPKLVNDLLTKTNIYAYHTPSGRLQNPVCTLSRKVRPHTKFYEEEPYSVDWSHAHYVILYDLPGKLYKYGGIEGIEKEKNVYVGQKEFVTLLKLFTNNELGRIGGEKDFQHFGQLAKSAQLYGFIHSKTAGLSLSKIKQMCCEFINTDRPRGQVAAAFERFFPTVCFLLRKMKGWDGRKYLHHTLVSQWNLWEEARIVYRWLVPQLVERDLPFINIHDGIICRESDANAIHSLFVNCLSNGGYESTVKVKRWT